MENLKCTIFHHIALSPTGSGSGPRDVLGLGTHSPSTIKTRSSPRFSRGRARAALKSSTNSSLFSPATRLRRRYLHLSAAAAAASPVYLLLSTFLLLSLSITRKNIEKGKYSCYPRYSFSAKFQKFTNDFFYSFFLRFFLNK